MAKPAKRKINCVMASPPVHRHSPSSCEWRCNCLLQLCYTSDMHSNVAHVAHWSNDANRGFQGSIPVIPTLCLKTRPPEEEIDLERGTA